VSTAFPDQANVASLAIDGQGRIIAAGSAFGSSTSFDFTVARYLSNGTLDPTFNAAGTTTGVPGTATFDFGGVGKIDGAQAVALDSRGGIILAGDRQVVTSNFDFALIRVNPDGTRDTSFGPTGSNGFVS